MVIIKKVAGESTHYTRDTSKIEKEKQNTEYV